ncbi:MAG TPA: GNAT family N-acetyltransferase [Candidatus Binataceae bacterium]|nr:GNAT family N-acetyltransferase [Candidatus Binataceae bacterium]
MVIRKHREGELVIEQTRDLALVRALLERAAMLTDGIDAPSSCCLLAYFGHEPVGMVGVEPRLDAALIRSLYVVDTMRSRGIGAALVAAARKAAHTRGAQHLYLFSTDAGDFFRRLGFEQISVDRVLSALKGAPHVEHYRAHPDQLAKEIAYHLDISRDGVIER